jgi:eukaryotic-like serine/threonine-protein kinase
MQKTQVIPPATPGYLQPGEIIGERYRLERELGRGSMGTVWSAVHVTLGQRVAIKLISAELVESPEARLRFSNEAKAAARLKSRHVVLVYDDGQTADGMPYIVMEHLDGETVEGRIERAGDLPLVEAVRVVTHVCRALSRAHAQGIIHRDLKPANIFLCRSEDDEHGWLAKVLDFGVAKLMGAGDASATKTGALVGTPLFMAPEQVRGASHADQRADLYSLGMVFYNMVSGRFAFDSPSYSDVLIKICVEPLPDLKEVAPWISEPVRQWYNKACAREPGERFQSADEMMEALQQAAERSQPERNSFPDQAMGPSGTVVGYSSPEGALGSTLALAQPSAAQVIGGTAVLPPQMASEPSAQIVTTPSAQHRAPPAPYSANPWAAAPPPPYSAALEQSIPGVPKRSVWPLFLAAGAGLGLAIAGGVMLILLLRSGSEGAPKPAASAPALVALPALAAPTAPVAQTATRSPPPALPAPETTTSAAAAAAATSARRKSVRATAAPRPATATPPRAPAPKPAPKGGQPDIGF